MGLSARDLGVTREVLDSHFLYQVAYLDPASRSHVESSSIEPFFEIHKAEKIPTIDDHREIGLEVRPPDVWRYFVRAKPDRLARFAHDNMLEGLAESRAEEEFVYRNTVNLNRKYYASHGKKQAFVLSHGRNLMILKIVGYAEQVTRYYCLDDFRAHGWIAHQRYPTRGRLWHPGGAHPFSGMHEALVHNGDFANYHAVCEYLYQHNIYPQFLTDTEVSVLLLDLYNRVFEYPMEYIIEALAPTTEHDFDLLSEHKQEIYRIIQSRHISCSPDGPWFFIIARNDPYKELLQLIGITDTSMLRPQVFAIQEGEVQIGLVCSEKQAIDATLQSLAAEDSRFCTVADKYWNARGGSASDGGTFTFTLKKAGNGDGTRVLEVTNKFGDVVKTPSGKRHYDPGIELSVSGLEAIITSQVDNSLESGNPSDLTDFCVRQMEHWEYADVKHLCRQLVNRSANNDNYRTSAIAVLTMLNDRVYPGGTKKRGSILQLIRNSLTEIFNSCPGMDENPTSAYRSICFATRDKLRAPGPGETTLVVNAGDFRPEGEDCDSRLLNAAYRLGWKQFICHGYRGQRFTGCGFGQKSDNVRIDVYGSSGDYLASGIDGMEIHVHGNAQDQLGQIMKRGKLVVHGDVGQTFMYGAKGGHVFVKGNAAGRPLINGTGHPRVVINGTCLDYLAESFMAGDPLNGGGFVILNGMESDDEGAFVNQPTPYPGSNLFSLASGGAIYIRDPFHKVVEGQLNGGEIVDLSPADWDLILPYLKENERLFGISIQEDLLTVDGSRQDYARVYRKVQAVKPETPAQREFVTHKEEMNC